MAHAINKLNMAHHAINKLNMAHHAINKLNMAHHDINKLNIAHAINKMKMAQDRYFLARYCWC